MRKKLIKLIAMCKTPQGFFVWVTLLFGGIFILAIPPLQTPDEAAHFLRAYQISNFEFIPSQKDGITGSDIPVSFQKVQEAIEGGGAIQTRPTLKYKLGNTKAALVYVPLDETRKVFMDTSVTASYSPVGYVPQALAVGLGRVLNAPPIIMIYLAKLLMLITWTGLVFVSIKLFPFKKWAVVGIALLPMFLSQSVSLGVDVIAIGSGILFTSTVLACLYRKTAMTRKELLLLIGAGVAMVLSKQVMVFLLGLILALPGASLSKSSKKSWLLKIGLILIPVASFGIWSLFLPDISSNITQLTNGQNTFEQIKYIFQNPWMFIMTFFNTFFFTPGDGISQSLMGNFGWLDTPLSALFINAGYASLFVYWFINYEGKNNTRTVSKVNKAVFAGIAVLYFIGVCAALYILFSPVAFPIIIGIQGRYLFPCLFLLLPVFFTNIFTTKEKYFVRFTKIMSITLLAASVITIVFRYYITVY